MSQEYFITQVHNNSRCIQPGLILCSTRQDTIVATIEEVYDLIHGFPCMDVVSMDKARIHNDQQNTVQEEPS